MPETIIASQEQPQNAVSANWDALNTTEVSVTAPAATEVATPEVETKGEVTTLEVKPDVPATIEETPAATTESAAPATETPAELSLDVKDIKDAPTIYPENSLQSIAQTWDLKLATDSKEDLIKAINENFVPKAKADEMAALGKENLLATLKPEVAAAVKLKELGIPEEFIFNPTGQHDAILALDDVQMLRLKFENTPGYDEAMVDAKMEELASDPHKLETLAKIERAGLNTERVQILEKQSQLVQQYTEQKQQAEIKAKQEADQKFLEVLGKEPTFLGLPISKEAKAVIEAKFKKGSYDNVLNDAGMKFKAIMQHEFGEVFQKTALAKAQAKGKEEIVAKLSDVPPKKDLGGARAITQTEGVATSNWDALPT